MIYLELFWTFFCIGAVTIGGGYAMLPLMQSEILKKGWMTLPEIVDFIAVSESTPGPFAINAATYVGTEEAGFFGAVCATLGMVLPSFVIILLIAKFFQKYQDNWAVTSVIKGLKPAVVGLIGSAVVSIFMTVFLPNTLSLDYLTSPDLYFSIVVLGASLVLAFKKVHPIVLILLSALGGILFGVFV